MAFHARCEKCGSYAPTQPGPRSFPIPALPTSWHRLFLQDDSPNVTVEPGFIAVLCGPCSQDLWTDIELKLKFRDPSPPRERAE